jgi:uncharacterized protein (TIGR02145 family)
VADIDGNLYTTVIIGTQEWMVQNLKTTKYADGTPIPNLIINGAWLADTTGAYCWYNNEDPLDPSADTSIFDYGCLYNWYAVDNAHGLAPTGWRIPNEVDWLALITYLGGWAIAGGKLKEIGTTHWTVPNAGATDEYGFKFLPAGNRDNVGNFGTINNDGAVWSSDAHYGDAYYHNADYAEIYFTLGSLTYKKTGFSVRCMRDITVGTTYVSYTDGVDTYRKGVRSHAFVIDVVLTPLGFSGIKGIDWENIKTVTP